MKSFKPKDAIRGYLPGNSNELFIDIKYLEDYMKPAKTMFHQQGQDGLLLALGKTAFVYDVESCEIREGEE